MLQSEFELLERCLLVQVELTQIKSQEDLNELRLLAESARGSVVSCICCKRDTPDPSTFVGKGKVIEIADAVVEHEINTVIFNNSLTPAQERNLEKILKVRVMDRVALILTIFSQRARTYEGKLQVELANLQYQQARLVRGWTHLERQKGGFGLRGGPGETQIELDRRALRERIAAVKEALDAVLKRREQNRSLREKNAVPIVSFVGYTNAGKSSLFNVLTHANVYAQDQLFATLDPTLRSLRLPTVGKVILADTVGFIRNLPHDLIAAFRGTLEETAKADLLLHVVDASDENKDSNIEAVKSVLSQLGSQNLPTLIVYNKSDLVDGSAKGIIRNSHNQPQLVYVSAKTGEGINFLLEAIQELLSARFCEFTARLGAAHGRLRSMLYASKAVVCESYDDEGQSIVSVKITPVDAAMIDSRTNGQLTLTCLEKEKPWKKNNNFDFDFDSVM
jgi:GTP-binding protein HflX